MQLDTKNLYIKESTIPGAGKGLFTRENIKKGTRILEYKGKKTTWEKVSRGRIFNAYVFYISDDHVIDARTSLNSLGRYANDARGLSRTKGIINNCSYTIEDGKVYIDAVRNIPAGGEILVPYGKDYWDTIKENMKIEEEERKEANLKKTGKRKIISQTHNSKDSSEKEEDKIKKV